MKASDSENQKDWHVYIFWILLEYLHCWLLWMLSARTNLIDYP